MLRVDVVFAPSALEERRGEGCPNVGSVSRQSMCRGSEAPSSQAGGCGEGVARASKASAKLEGRVVPARHKRSAAVTRYIVKLQPPRR